MPGCTANLITADLNQYKSTINYNSGQYATVTHYKRVYPHQAVPHPPRYSTSSLVNVRIITKKQKGDLTHYSHVCPEHHEYIFQVILRRKSNQTKRVEETKFLCLGFSVRLSFSWKFVSLCVSILYNSYQATLR